MVRKLSVIVLSFILAMTSCGTTKAVQENSYTETKKDSVHVEVQTRIVYDTVLVELPAEREKNVTPDDSSHLENSVAVSDACIRDGRLVHTLETKQAKIQVPVSVPVSDTTKTSTSIIETEKKEVEYQIEYIEKDLSWWQRTQIYGFWCMLMIAILSFAWKYRNKIIPLIRRFI